MLALTHSYLSYSSIAVITVSQANHLALVSVVACLNLNKSLTFNNIFLI